MNSSTLKIAIEVDDKGSVKIRQFGKDAAVAGAEASRGLGSVHQASMKAEGGITKASAATSLMKSTLVSLASVMALDKLIELADAYTRIEGRLKLVTGSSAELASVQTALYDIAQRSRTEYIATADVYSRFAQATKGQNIAQSELLTITEALNKAFVISGANTQEQSAAMVQLSQGFASGVLRGDEFNSVMESGGRVIDMLTAYTGKSRGELRAMAEAGEITGDVLRNAIMAGAAGVNSEFERMPVTVGTASEKLYNALSALVADANKASGATAGIASSIDGIADSIDRNRAGIIGFFKEMANGAIISQGGAEMMAEAAGASINKMAAVVTASGKIKKEIAEIEAKIAVVTSNESMLPGVKAESLRIYGEQIATLKDGIKDLTSSAYVTGEAVGKSMNTVVTATRMAAEGNKELAFHLLGVKTQSESTMKATEEAHEKTIAYTETRREALAREREEMLKGARNDAERAKVELAYRAKVADLDEQESKRAETASNKAESAAKKLAQEHQAVLDKLLPLEAEQREYNKQLDILNKMAPALTAEQYKTALENLASTLSVNAEKTRELKAARESLADWDVKVAQVNMSAAGKEIDDLQRANALIEKRIELLVASGDITRDVADQYHQAFGVQLQRDIGAVNEKTSEMSKMFEDVAKNIQSGFASMFEDIFSGGANTMQQLVGSIKAMFVKMLAQLATMAIAKPIIIPMIAAVGSAMGVSNAGIAQAAGTDVGTINNLTSTGTSLLGSAVTGSSLSGYAYNTSALTSVAGQELAVQNAAIFADNVGATTLAESISDMSTSAFAGWSAGILTFVSGLLSGEDFAKAAAKGVGAGVGAWGGMKAGAAIGTYIWPGVGTAVGGVIGAALGAIAGSSIMGSMFKEKEDDFGVPQSVAAENSHYTAGKGFVPEAHVYDPNFNETAQWYHPILSAYSSTVATIQDSFDETLKEFTATLPAEMRDQMMAELASTDMTAILAKASEGEWKAKDAETALKQIAEAYAKGLDAKVSEVYSHALGDFVSLKGAGGLLEDTAAWAMLTDQVQANIEEAFSAAALQIKGGDIEAGTAAISSVSDIIAQIGQAMEPIQEIIDTNGLSEYELAIRSINLQFDGYSEALKTAGVDMAKYTQLEEARAIALKKVVEQQRDLARAELATAGEKVTGILKTIADQVQAFADRASAAEAVVATARDNISAGLWAAQDEQLAAQEEVNALIKEAADNLRAFAATIDDFLAIIDPSTSSTASLANLKDQLMVTSSAAAAGDADAQTKLLTQAQAVLNRAEQTSTSAVEYARAEAFVRQQLLMVRSAITPGADEAATSIASPMEQAQAALDAANAKVAEYLQLALEAGANTDRTLVIAADSVTGLTTAYNEAVAANTQAQAEYQVALELTKGLTFDTSTEIEQLIANLDAFEVATDDFLTSIVGSVNTTDGAAAAIAAALGLTGTAAEALALGLSDPARSAGVLAVLLGLPGTSATALAATLGLTGAEADIFKLRLTGLTSDTFILTTQFGLTTDAAQALLDGLNSPVDSLATLDALFGSAGDQVGVLSGMLGITRDQVESLREGMASTTLESLGLADIFGDTGIIAVTLGDAFSGIDADRLADQFVGAGGAAESVEASFVGADTAATLLVRSLGGSTAASSLLAATLMGNEDAASNLGVSFNTVQEVAGSLAGQLGLTGAALASLTTVVNDISLGGNAAVPAAATPSAIDAIYQVLFGRDADQAGEQYWMDSGFSGSTLFSAIRNGAIGADIATMRLRGYATGTNYMLHDGPIYAHAGETITPKPFVDLERSERAETNALLRGMRTELEKLRKTAESTEDVLVKVTRGGRAVRTEAAA